MAYFALYSDEHYWQALILVEPWITRGDSLRIRGHKVRYKSASTEERDAAVERLREFIRLNYITGNEIARRIGARDTTVYSWLQGKIDQGLQPLRVSSPF